MCITCLIADLKYLQLVFLSVFALLVSNTAGSLASRLAGSLALAASAVLCALAKILGLNGLDMFHCNNLPKIFTVEL